MAKELIEEDKEHEGKKIRPPNMWNHPETLNELERRFRPSSDPLQSYKDDRVKRLLEEIHQLARHISTNTEDWKFLIENIVIFFETANKKMTDLKLKPVLDTEDPEINPDASP